MRLSFQPCLVNGPFAEPALFVDLLFERRDRDASKLNNGLLLDEPALQVSCAVLGHGVPRLVSLSCKRCTSTSGRIALRNSGWCPAPG